MNWTKLVPATFVPLWATGFIGARYAMPFAEPFTLLAARFFLAFVILAFAVGLIWRRWPSPREALHAAGAGALMHGVYLGGVFWAIRQGMPAGLPALIVGLQPLITALLAGRLLGERILPRHWLGLIVGFVGVCIVLAPKLGELGSGVTAATIAASFVGVAGMSAGTIWQKRHGGGGDLITGACWQYAGAALLMGLGSLAFETRAVTMNAQLVLALLWMVLVLSIGAIVLLMIMIRDGEMSKVASLFYLVPAVTALIAWELFDETLTWVQVGGMAITTAGVGLAMARGPARQPAG